MPARQKPVINLLATMADSEVANSIVRLTHAPARAQTVNTFEGENLSAIVNSANNKVPLMKPSCTADVICASAEDGR